MAAETGTQSPFPDRNSTTSSGFRIETNTFHSLRPSVPLPPLSLPLSFPSFAFSLLPSPLPSNPALLDAATGRSLSYPDFLSQVHFLSLSLETHFHLSNSHVAFVLSPPSLHLPILYFALLSLGVIVTPSNPVSTPSEISRQIALTNPSIAFATSSTSHKIPSRIPTVLLDSPLFSSLLIPNSRNRNRNRIEIRQSDAAAIQFSSGTTGMVKAAAVPHRSFIAMAAGFHAMKPSSSRSDHQVTLLAAPMFHSLGFFFSLKGVALGETVVVVRERAGFGEMLAAAENYRATAMTAAPPVVGAMARSEEAVSFDLRRLERVFCGGAPLAVEAAERFMERFPRVELSQGYGSTEAGGISRMIGHNECRHLRSVGRLSENVESKIVDVVTGKAMSVGQQGELLVRGPAVMIGYVGDDEANASTFDSDGWLKTGDLCYFDSNGFLHIVDRLKELIKYKAYQVPPAELEHVLQSLPDIVDAAVIPYPHEEAGQIPMAFVVRQPGSNINEAQVMDYVAKQVAPYKKIRKVVFINSIPKSPAGKILRRELARNAVCGPVLPRL